jgi:hypothetical protein
MQHCMDGALGRHADVAIETAHQQLPDLAGAPMGGLSRLQPTIRLSIWLGSWLA